MQCKILLLVSIQWNIIYEIPSVFHNSKYISISVSLFLYIKNIYDRYIIYMNHLIKFEVVYELYYELYMNYILELN